jgi:YidC/Oxa1 family membrane protein insertase
LKVIKTFSLVDPKLVGSDYLLDLNLAIENATPAPVSLNNMSLALGTAAPLYELETPNWTSFFWRGNGEYTFEDATFFKGGMFSSDKAGFEIPIESAEYAGVANQFFATVVRTKEPYKGTLWARPVDVNLPTYEGGLSRPAVRGGIGLPPVDVAAGEQRSLAYQIFMGPKKNQMLRAMDGNLGDIMNYGVFGIVSNPLNWLLNKLHGWFDPISPKWSWGFAVVALTIVIRTLIWPLHAKSTRTMKRMSKIQPEQKALKEKYGDDPARLNQETMKLYKKYSVNPLGGCLPMFLQIPIFFGFYRMLQYAVELRHQEFLWWVNDLSQPDTIHTFDIMGWSIPFNLLPILMGITMVIQMRMTPQTGDAMQRRIMMFMPIIFLYFCYSFASALALYWTTQNIFSIGQTWLMNKMPEPELKPRKAGKKSWVEKLSERQSEMKKAQENRGAGGPAGPPTKKKRPPRTGG